MGADRPRRVAVRPTPACSSTTRFKSGTRAPTTSGSTQRIRARNTSSSTIRLALLPRRVSARPDGLRTVEELYKQQQTGGRVFVTTDIHSELDHRRLGAHRPAFVTKVGERDVFRMTLADGRADPHDGRPQVPDGGRCVEAARRAHARRSRRNSRNRQHDYLCSDSADVKRWQMLGWLTGDGVFNKDTVALVFGPTRAPHGRAHDRAAERTQGCRRRLRRRENAPRFCKAASPRSTTASCKRRPRSHRSCPTSSSGTDSSKPRPSTRTCPPAIHHARRPQSCVSAGPVLRRRLHTHERRVPPRPEVMLASSSPQLLRSVQLILSDLGMTSRITWIHPTGRKNPQGQLHLYNQQARNFLSLVGFPCSQAKEAKATKALRGRSWRHRRIRVHPR